MAILASRCLLVALGATVLLLENACGSSETDTDPFGGAEEVQTDYTGPDTRLGKGQMTGSGRTTEQYEKADVSRDGVNYQLMANGWGDGWESHAISWNGTSFTVESLEGSLGPNYQPAAYPTVFCGVYSSSASGDCGLPAAIDSLTSVQTGWRWAPNGNTGEYNAAYDVWLGNGPTIGDHSGFFMVWFRKPPGQSPAGTFSEVVSVENVPGQWSLYVGTVNDWLPIINYVRAPRSDTYAMEFDLLDFIADARSRGLTIPGTHILGVAVGFEVWNGPINNLESVDFYVDVR